MANWENDFYRAKQKVMREIDREMQDQYHDNREFTPFMSQLEKEWNELIENHEEEYQLYKAVSTFDVQ